MFRFAVAFALLGASPEPISFVAVPQAKSGISWRHDNTKSRDRHLPETVGGGVAVLDYDNDGWQDLYFVNSGKADFHSPVKPLRNALYRNLRNGSFQDVTASAGVAGNGGFGMGAAAADYDNDGDTDLLVTQYGNDILYRNNGNGTFTDVTAEAGIAGEGWHTSAVWFDYDRDGFLDLFISTYVAYRKDLVNLCYDQTLRVSAYCVPKMFASTASRLYHNNGAGKFIDVSGQAGIAAYPGKALGAVATDIDNDGWPDLFVASDMAPNALFWNLGGKRFEEIGLEAGVAYGEDGEPRSGMGVDAVDFDGDGKQDLFVANIDQQYFALYRNEGERKFSEQRGPVRTDTRLLSGWGLKFFDMDNDGDPDLLLGNGHPDDMISKRMPGVTYAEPLLLFENRLGAFKNVSRDSGAVFQGSWNARGLVTVDFDNDGDLDAVIGINGGAPLLLRNEGGNRGRWLGLRLPPETGNARIEWIAGGVTRSRQRSPGGSFLSSHDPREILGLGGATGPVKVTVTWGDGTVITKEFKETGQYNNLTR